MSYILEALRKAERERHLGRVPDLETVCAPLTPPPRRRFWPWLLVGLALLVNVALLFAVFVPREQEPLAQIDEVTTPPSPAAATSLTAAPAPPPAPPPVQTARTIPVIQPIKPGFALSARSPAGDAPADAAEPDMPAYAELSAAEMAQLETVPAFVTDADSLPLLWELPEDFYQVLPTLNVDIHVYNEAAAKRFVMINSRRYREGEALAEGPLLEEITADGVILNHQGLRFLLPIAR